ncbi:MAG: NAD(P)/FAD-dependent oxidoreductase [Phycisphaeraceae bacterium]
MSDSERKYDLVIVGGGAAGMTAAIFAGRAAGREQRIALLDGAAKLGAKILVSGGGRCNVTHDVVSEQDYFGGRANHVRRVLRTLSVEKTIDFFAELGVKLKREETGKLFPVTDRAKTVLDALLGAVEQAGVEILPGHRVSGIARDAAGFLIETSQGPIAAKRVILATGGRSLPKTGSDGQAYGFARKLGHTVTETTPALVPLVLEDGCWLTKLSGISFEAELTLAGPTGKVLHRETGPTLLTHFGLSGPAPMNLSRHWIAARAKEPGVTLAANLVGGRSFEAVERELIEGARRRPRAGVASRVQRWLPERLAAALVEQAAGTAPSAPAGQMTRDARRAIVHGLTALPLPVVRDRGWLHAEVTAGGVPLEEVNLRTMASKRCEGLYLCGEILDVDGRIGGYNFQWAWCSGRLAGQGAASS